MEKVIDIRPIKKKMRAEARESRRSMDAFVKSTYDKKICNKLLNLWAVRETETFLCYVSTDIEVDTKEFINSLLSSGKKVAVPRCEGGPSEMNFYYINSLDELSSGSFGVLEPESNKEKMLTETENTICIVPAFMFDKFGYRLGYGKGYYDRFLSAHPDMHRVGICYCCCTVTKLTHGRFDVSVNTLVTEKYVKNCEIF